MYPVQSIPENRLLVPVPVPAGLYLAEAEAADGRRASRRITLE